METIIDWLDPKKVLPPFNKRILVLLGGQGSLDCMKTLTRYVTVSDVIVLRQSPNDDGDAETEYERWISEADRQAAYHNYQFDVIGWAAYQYEDAGGECGEPAEWYSDAIVAWAPMPDLSFALSTPDEAGGGHP